MDLWTVVWAGGYPRVHDRRPADLFHLRETRGAEIDLLVEAGARLLAVEVKSGAPVVAEHLATLRRFVENRMEDPGQAHRERYQLRPRARR